MSFNLKTAAANLLKLADRLDKEAAEKTFLMCNICGHKATLASINGCRTKLASERALSTVKSVTVNDRIVCGALSCEGTMSYMPTKESEKFYVEAAEEVTPTDDTSIDEDETPPEEGLDESVFEPVDEQDAKKEAPAEGAPEGEEGAPAPQSEGSEPSFEEMPKPLGPTNPANEDELMPEEKPDQGKPQDVKEEVPDGTDYDTPSTDEPPSDEPPAEEPPSNEPPAEEPSIDESPVEEPPSDEPSSEESPSNEPPAEGPPSDEPSTEEPPAEEPPAEEPGGEVPEETETDPVDEETPGGDVPEEITKKKKIPVSEPKFTEMPEDMKELKLKTAGERFWSSVARYTIK